MLVALREEGGAGIEIGDVLARAPLDQTEAYLLMLAFADALKSIHSMGELWDHCEKGVEICFDGTVIIHGTVSKRNARLKPDEVDENRSVAPPEFILSGIHERRSDIFSWGIIAYELITGECPLKGESIVELIKAAEDCNFIPPENIRPDFPLGLCRVVSKAISRNLEDRFQTSEELVTALNTALRC